MRKIKGFTPLEIFRRKNLINFFAVRKTGKNGFVAESQTRYRKLNQFRFLTGFTLIESVIYVGLFIVIAAFVGSVVYRVFEESGNLSAMVISEDEANFLLRKIDWGLIGASAINYPPTGTPSSTLSLNKINFSANPIVFDLNAGNLRLKKGTGAPQILNGSRIKVANIIFEHFAAAGKKPEGVKITLSIERRQYETTIYLRK